MNNQEAVRSLFIAMNKMDGAYYFCAKKLGMKHTTLTLLYALSDGKHHSQKQICEDWLLPKTTLNTIVIELVKVGRLTLRREDHTREKTISLTPEGQAYANRMTKSMEDAERQAVEKVLQRFSPEFIDAFDYFADCLCSELQAHVLHSE